jgi:hypothetical protein
MNVFDGDVTVLPCFFFSCYSSSSWFHCLLLIQDT